MSSLKGDMLITADEARKFMNEILNVEFTIIQQPRQQNLDYLNRIISAFMNKIPFQNFTYLCLPGEERTLPSVHDVVDSVLSGVGGLCWTNNIAIYFLLQTLGFTVYLGNASPGVRGSNDHVIVFARNVVKNGDTYLVEAGFANPTFSAICLDFDTESDTMSYSYNTSKYIKRGEEYIRLHKTSRNIDTFPLVEGDWSLAYFFKLEPLSIETLSEIMLKAYGSPEFFFNKALRTVIFQNNCATVLKTTDAKKAVILIEDSNNELQVTAEYEIDGQKDEFIKHLITMFPMVPNVAISKAIDNYLKNIS